MKEILIKYILIDETSVMATPVRCPNEDSPDILIVGDTICCVYNESRCPYLDSIVFEKDVNRTLFCRSE